MPDVRSVTAQIQPATETFPGQVTTGYYTVEAGKITMTTADGVPVLDPTTKAKFEFALRDGDNESRIAAMLTKDVRRALRGESKDTEKFRQAIDYSQVFV